MDATLDRYLHATSGPAQHTFIDTCAHAGQCTRTQERS